MTEVVQTILRWDDVAFRFVNETLYSPLPFVFFQVITNAVDAVIVFLCTYLLVSRILRKRASETDKIVVTVLIPVFVAALITLFLKVVIHRGAPAPFIVPWLEFEFLPVRYVFPSGHTSRAFALATALAIEFPRWRLFYMFVAALIGFSRVYVGAHYPTDVLAGAILGSLISWTFLQLGRRGQFV